MQHVEILSGTLEGRTGKALEDIHSTQTGVVSVRVDGYVYAFGTHLLKEITPILYIIGVDPLAAEEWLSRHGLALAQTCIIETTYDIDNMPNDATCVLTCDARDNISWEHFSKHLEKKNPVILFEQTFIEWDDNKDMSTEYHGKSNAYTFALWEKAVDNIISAKFELGMSDFEDWPSRATYENRLSPMEGAEVWAEYMDQSKGGTTFTTLLKRKPDF